MSSHEFPLLDVVEQTTADDSAVSQNGEDLLSCPPISGNVQLAKPTDSGIHNGESSDGSISYGELNEQQAIAGGLDKLHIESSNLSIHNDCSTLSEEVEKQQGESIELCSVRDEELKEHLASTKNLRCDSPEVGNIRNGKVKDMTAMTDEIDRLKMQSTLISGPISGQITNDDTGMDILSMINFSKRVLLIGDTVFEKYAHGNYSKLERENTLPVFRITSNETRLGGVVNIARNLNQLGISVDMVSAIGQRDGKVIAKLQGEIDNIDLSGIIYSEDYKVRVKTHFCSSHTTYFTTEENEISNLSEADYETCKENIASFIKSGKYDAIVLSDNGHGIVNESICKNVMALSKAMKTPVFVYSNAVKKYQKFFGCICIVFNADRLESKNGVSQFCQEICERMTLDACIATVSENSLALCQRNKGQSCVYETFPLSCMKSELDSSGEGDAILAAAVFGRLNVWSWRKTCRFASMCAANVVQRRGSVSLSLVDVLPQKILTTKQEVFNLRRIIPSDRIVAITTGCFDMIHVGHIESLRQGKQLSDIFIVLLNSDSSVKLYKDKSRPIIPMEQRRDMLLATQYVDFIVVFDERTPSTIVEILKPDIFVKGEEYRSKDLRNSYPFIRKIHYTPQMTSTSNIIKKIKET